MPNPSPWLKQDYDFQAHEEASFVEYLRWMRLPNNSKYKDGQKIDLLCRAQTANFDTYLTRRIEQLRRLIEYRNGECLEVQCAWRIRVGGLHGPENILLPAFDAQGVPYIPASSLRGVARTQAVQDIGKDAAAKIFGDLETPNQADHMGKVIFFDAYPLPEHAGLSLDMANNIWSWEGSDLKYKSNPNLFFSLKDSIFCLGLALANHCDQDDILAKVKTWLIQGLKAGIGSQINSGYGEVVCTKEPTPRPYEKIILVDFELEGQLIHSYQKFTGWTENRDGKLKMTPEPCPEVRAIAFKNMMRYWFRVFARGVLSTQTVQILEGNLFGSIEPKCSWGWLKFDIINGRSWQDDDPPRQTGTLLISEAPSFSTLPPKSQKAVIALVQRLTWILFHLGGIGQGARRPLHSRNNPPYKRGSQLTITNVSRNNLNWELPKNPQDFINQLKAKLKTIYKTLNHLSHQKINGLLNITSEHDWEEVADQNCVIVACLGERQGQKPYSLATLHKLARQNLREYDSDLCGGQSLPSPVWITNTDYYQIVTIFGVDHETRANYLNQLLQNAITPAEIELSILLP
jgi:CRISPR-associated protein Cmr6